MCVMSMIMKHRIDQWKRLVPYPYVPPPAPKITEAELREFRELLERAREYDKRHHQPDCELDSKRKQVKKLAKKLGVEVDFL